MQFIQNTIIKMKSFGKLKIILFSLAGAFFVAASIAFIIIYSEGDRANENAQELLSHYEQETDTAAQQTQSAAPAETFEFGAQTSAPTLPPQVLDDEYEGYEIIGKLTIDKIDVVLPVIAQMSNDSLKVSVCYYKGELPTGPGNLVITGHNYSSGAHFGRLDEVAEGDLLVFTSPDGVVYHYVVYDTLVLKPDQAEVLDEVSNDYELTLFTCSRRGNRRFVVRAKLIDD